MYCIELKEYYRGSGIPYWGYLLSPEIGKDFCFSVTSWDKKEAAIIAAKKVASDLGIEYRD